MIEDEDTKCGYGYFTLYTDPKDDPFIDACAHHDNQTTIGSVAQEVLTLKQVQEVFDHNIDVIVDRHSGTGYVRILGSFYKLMTRGFTWLFWEGK